MLSAWSSGSDMGMGELNNCLCQIKTLYLMFILQVLEEVFNTCFLYRNVKTLTDRVPVDSHFSFFFL